MGAPLVAPGAVRAPVLDVACGAGRHLRWFHGTGPSRDRHRPRPAGRAGGGRRSGEAIEADIENDPWPLADRRFDAVVVTNYLWRPLFPRLLESMTPGGVLLYETFAQGHELIGKPGRPDFLLAPGELLRVCSGLRVVAYEHGCLAQPDRFVQRIAAVLEPAGAGPLRYPL
jgi:SAM-dependent methyltransferase